MQIIPQLPQRNSIMYRPAQESYILVRFAGIITGMGSQPMRDDVTTYYSEYGLSQWETTLRCNVVSHWLSPYSEWSLGLVVFSCGVVSVDVAYVFGGICHPGDNKRTCTLVPEKTSWRIWPQNKIKQSNHHQTIFSAPYYMIKQRGVCILWSRSELIWNKSSHIIHESFIIHESGRLTFVRKQQQYCFLQILIHYIMYQNLYLGCQKTI